MDHPVKSKNNQSTAAAPPRPPAAAEAVAKKKPTTLLDAYEVECIRRELERLVLRQNQSAGRGGAPAATDAHGHHRHHHHHHQHHSSSCKKPTSAKKVRPSPPAPHAPGTKGRGVRLLARHAVAIFSGTVPVAVSGAGVVGGARRRRHGGYREGENV